jgi:hypothetical protein
MNLLERAADISIDKETPKYYAMIRHAFHHYCTRVNPKIRGISPLKKYSPYCSLPKDKQYLSF